MIVVSALVIKTTMTIFCNLYFVFVLSHNLCIVLYLIFAIILVLQLGHIVLLTVHAEQHIHRFRPPPPLLSGSLRNGASLSLEPY